MFMKEAINGIQYKELEHLLNERQQEMEELNKKEEKLLKYFSKIKEKMEQEKYLEKSKSIRLNQNQTKKVTSIAIHEQNQKIIKKLQEKARQEGFFLSKENLVNMGLQLLDKEVSKEPIQKLFMNYKQ